jgi:hypothetical protein
MKHLRIILTFTLALLLPGSAAWLPAGPGGALASTPAQGRSLEPDQAPPPAPDRGVPSGLDAAERRAIQTQAAKLAADDGAAGDRLGFSVSLDGDTALVGASYADGGGSVDQGAAYVFYRDQGGAGAWGQVAKLTAADGAAGDRLGYSLSVAGDTAVVGAPNADPGGSEDRGAAYVFYRDQGGPDAWGQVAKLTVADGEADDWFGYSTSVNGDTVVVGAWQDNGGGGINQGAAYVFYRDQGGADAWGQVAKLTAAGGAAYDYFGSSVSVDGDTALIGAQLVDIGGHDAQGAAYVFYRNLGGADAWGQAATLTAADGAAQDYLGWSASLDADTAVVGAWQADVGGNADQGAAYVFYRNLGGPDAWGQVAKLAAADGAAGDWFGYSVSVSGEAGVVGAYRADPGGSVDQGAAYLFRRDQGGADAWGQVDRLTADDGAAGDWFGIVSADGDTAVAGAPMADVGGAWDQGAAYVYCPLFPPPTMHVASVGLTKAGTGPWLLTGKGKIHDGDHADLPGVLVTAQWLLPNGTKLFRNFTTGAQGGYQFNLNVPVSGQFRFCIAQLVKAGYIYVKGDNHAQPPCRLISTP